MPAENDGDLIGRVDFDGGTMVSPAGHEPALVVGRRASRVFPVPYLPKSHFYNRFVDVNWDPTSS